MKNKILFLDETGHPNPKHGSPRFILSGCLIPEEHLIDLRNSANGIIFKYWGSHKSFSRRYGVNNIVFRAKDIFDCNGPFVILKSSSLKKAFWNDIYSQLLSRPDIVFFITLLDKRIAVKNHPTWTIETSLTKSYEALLGAFIMYLIKSEYTGEIVAESSAIQDIALVNSLSIYQRNSLKFYKDSQLVNRKITSLSLVNKNDNNIGAQMADLISWTGANKYLIDNKLKKFSGLRFEEKRLLKMFESKIKRKRSKLSSKYLIIS